MAYRSFQMKCSTKKATSIFFVAFTVYKKILLLCEKAGIRASVHALHSPPSSSTHASRPLRSINIIVHNSDARLSLVLLYSVWSDLSDISLIASSTVHVTDHRNHCLKPRRPNIPVQSPTNWLTHPFTYHNQLQFRLILLLWEELIGKCFFCHWKLFFLWIDKYKNQTFSKNAINSVLLTDIACEAKLYLSIKTGLEEDGVVQYRIFSRVP